MNQINSMNQVKILAPKVLGKRTTLTLTKEGLFRTLRTNLQQKSKLIKNKKSTISSNLATILKMTKYKTLFINLELRKPSLHKFFNIPNNKELYAI